MTNFLPMRHRLRDDLGQEAGPCRRNPQRCKRSSFVEDIWWDMAHDSRLEIRNSSRHCIVFSQAFPNVIFWLFRLSSRSTKDLMASELPRSVGLG